MVVNECLYFACILGFVLQIGVEQKFQKWKYLINSILKTDKFCNWWALMLYILWMQTWRDLSCQFRFWNSFCTEAMLEIWNVSNWYLFRHCFMTQKMKMSVSKNFSIPNHGSDNEKGSTKNVAGKKGYDNISKTSSHFLFHPVYPTTHSNISSVLKIAFESIGVRKVSTYS